MNPAALAPLRKRCPVMRRLIRVHEPCMIVPDTRRSPFEAVVSAVAHQQLHGKAVAAVVTRFRQADASLLLT